MKPKKIISYLGFAAKSRGMVTGTNTCMMSMEKGRIGLLIIASDMAENSREKLIRKAENTNTNYRVYGESTTMGKACGKPGAVVFGITDEKFSKVIVDEIDNECRV